MCVYMCVYIQYNTSELGVVSIQVDHEAVFRSNVYNVGGVQSFLPGPGLGALRSSYLEGALYKFYR